MSITKRLAVMAIFINIMLLFFCPGIAFAGEYTGLRALLIVPMSVAPLVAFIFLIVGCVPKNETASSRTVCRVGLVIVAFSLISLAYCWDFSRNGVYELFPNLQAADVRSVEINLGTTTNYEVRMATLDEEDTAEFLTLVQQITCRNPHANIRQTDAYHQRCPSFMIAKSDNTNFRLTISPPYYVDNQEIAYLAENEEICQQLADLYEELSVKYAGADLDVAAAE